MILIEKNFIGELAKRIVKFRCKKKMIIRSSTKLSSSSKGCASRLPKRTRMNKTLMRKSMAVAVLLSFLALSAIAINTPLARADPVGIGKYLTIDIVGEGCVIATKVNSGEYWEFLENGTQKVGAGTILLEAFAAEGWNFSHWEGDLTGVSTPTTKYKTEKYGYIVAIFVKRTYTITAVAIGPGTINGETLLTVEVEQGGASPTFVFAPNNETLYHISSIKVDTDFINYTTEYTFPDPITSNHNIVVTFDDVGTATVPDDTDVTVFLASIASLFFDDTDGGTATGMALPFPEGTSVVLWEITTDANDTDVWVLIALQFNGTAPVAVYRADSADILYSDVDWDGDVDGTDVSLVAIAIKSLTPQGEYDPEFDIDRNGILDELDILTVNGNMGETLTPLNFWIEGNTLFIENDHWTTFRAR